MKWLGRTTRLISISQKLAKVFFVKTQLIRNKLSNFTIFFKTFYYRGMKNEKLKKLSWFMGCLVQLKRTVNLISDLLSWRNQMYPALRIAIRVSWRPFCILMPGVWFLWSKKKLLFFTFNHFYSEKSSKRAK